MKKLMIAAAAAAMIGGANAQLVYDFCASMKTTAAKSSSQSTTYSYKFGFAMNETTGDYWWKESEIEGGCLTKNGSYLDWSDGTYSATKLIKMDSKTGKGTIQTSVFNKMSQKEKEAFVASLAAYGNYDNPSDKAKSVTDPSYFDREPAFEGIKETYKGKKDWCLKVQWTQKVTDTSCYRVAGSVKLAGQYRTSDCCGGKETVWYADWSGKNASPAWLYDEDTKTTTYNVDLTPVFNYRFGALTWEKATKVEFVARIGADEQTQLPQLLLAGQGSVADVKDQYGTKSSDRYGEPQISSICGNIVGVWIDPMCDVCCGGHGDAVVFDCTYDDEGTLWDGNGGQGTGFTARASKDITAEMSVIQADNVREPIWENDWADDTGPLWGTAAYGTFTLKYNQKESVFSIL